MICAIAVLAILAPAQAWAQQRTLDARVMAQIEAISAAKRARTPGQRKLDSRLLQAIRMSRGEAVAAGVPRVRTMATDGHPAGPVLEIRAEVSQALLQRLRNLGAEVLDASARYRSVRARVPLRQIEAMAALPEISFVMPEQRAFTNRARPRDPLPGPRPGPLRDARRLKRTERAAVATSVQRTLSRDFQTNVGSRQSEGDVTHGANIARATYGVTGAGVRIGVLSDSVTSLAESQASGDLGPVTVLPGQAGPLCCDEGTAMLEIVHDVAPGAELFFATGVTGSGRFADNIRALAAAGCQIIVDDIGYFVESPFQDGQTSPSQTNGGIIAQAVKDVANAGVLYFSSAANAGNLNDGRSGTWEGNFVGGGPLTAPLSGPGTVHLFNGQPYNTFLEDTENRVTLFWTDPLGASANDYDLYILNAAGTQVEDFSNNLQTGTEDPYESVELAFAGERAVIVLYSGVTRFLHLDTRDAVLQVATAGSTRGHAATTAPNSFGVAATRATSPGPYPGRFNTSNTVESFSSDGPRRLFFAADGTPFTPGNVLATGGIVIQKPDFTAADGVSVTGVGGFPSTFYGTSASAPHAAAIAGLVKSYRPSAPASRVRAALLASVVDIEAPGVDRDSGAGILMADRAIAALVFGADGDFDGDGQADFTVFRPSNGVWYSASSRTGATQGVQWGIGNDRPVAGDYDGDGKTDIAVFRPEDGVWYVISSITGLASGRQWGIANDIPVPGDYDGDGRADIAVYRPGDGVWYVISSITGVASGRQWGGGSDIPVPGDYDGDGRADIAVFRPANGIWFIVHSSTGAARGFQWGSPADRPILKRP